MSKELKELTREQVQQVKMLWTRQDDMLTYLAAQQAW